MKNKKIEIQTKIEGLRSETSYVLPLESQASLNRILTELEDQRVINEFVLNRLRQRLLSDSPNKELYGSSQSLQSVPGGGGGGGGGNGGSSHNVNNNSNNTSFKSNISLPRIREMSNTNGFVVATNNYGSTTNLDFQNYEPEDIRSAFDSC